MGKNINKNLSIQYKKHISLLNSDIKISVFDKKK